MKEVLSFACAIIVLTLPVGATITATILAGGETDLPVDTPSGRLDTGNAFSFVGVLEISSGVENYKESAVALSRESNYRYSGTVRISPGIVFDAVSLTSPSEYERKAMLDRHRVESAIDDHFDSGDEGSGFGGG